MRVDSGFAGFCRSIHKELKCFRYITLSKHYSKYCYDELREMIVEKTSCLYIVDYSSEVEFGS